MPIVLLDERDKIELQKQIEETAPPIIQTVSGENIDVHDSADRSLRGLKIYGKTTQTDTGYSNVGDSGSVGVKVLGKNLLPYPYRDFEYNNSNTVTKNGITFTDNGDGSVTANGTATAGTSFSLAYWSGSTILNLPVGVPLTWSGTPSGGGSATYRLLLKTHDGEKQVATDDGNGATITLNYPKCYAYIWIANGAKVNNVVFKPMLEIGTAKTEYEKHKEAKTLSVFTPDGLAGLKVSFNGNYTDSNGQQWACDEINFERGVYIQRIKRVTYDGDEKEKWSVTPERNVFQTWGIGAVHRTDGGMIYASRYSFVGNLGKNGDCTLTSWAASFYNDTWEGSNSDDEALAAWRAHLGTNPLTVYYVLATPIETPLSAEQIEAFKDLHSHYPNTSITNDSGVEMEVEYVADTKNYIDNKFAELASAIANA